MIYLRLIEIAIITVIIIDISGFIDEVKGLIGKMLNIANVRLKPLDCSFCMTFWVSMGYLIYLGELSITTVMFALIMSVMTTVIEDLIYLIRDLIATIINKISNLIN